MLEVAIDRRLDLQMVVTKIYASLGVTGTCWDFWDTEGCIKFRTEEKTTKAAVLAVTNTISESDVFKTPDAIARDKIRDYAAIGYDGLTNSQQRDVVRQLLVWLGAL